MKHNVDRVISSELIVVCGPPRSGTTWLTRELCNAPTAYSFLPECTFLTQQIELYHRTRHYADIQRITAYFGSAVNVLDYFKANVRVLIENAIEINPKVEANTLILKDPNICFYLKDLNEILPTHKLVVLVRDPRDVIASMKSVTLKKNQTWNVKIAASDLLNYYYQIENHHQRGDTNCIFVRYEDLVLEEMANLFGFLHLQVPLVSAANAALTGVREQLDPTDPFFSEFYLRPTTAERVGSYASVLTRSEIRHIEKTYSVIIRRWNYPLSDTIRSTIVKLYRYWQPRTHEVKEADQG